MKNLITLLVLTILFVSCSSDSLNSVQNTQPSPTAGFTWRENSTTATVHSAASSELRTMYKSIFAFSNANGTGTLFEINLNAVSVGTYDLSVSGNSFYFVNLASGTITGNVKITSNNGSKASGTFEAISSGTGAITKVYGTFTDIPVN